MPNQSQIIIYQSKDGKISVDTLLKVKPTNFYNLSK